MADIKTHFVHPTDGRTLTVSLDNTMTSGEAIGELVANDFIPPSEMGYNLAIKGGAQLQNNESLADGGVKDGDTLRVIPATDAG